MGACVVVIKILFKGFSLTKTTKVVMESPNVNW